ncbi:MAG: aminoacyl-histidine dipeptidase [Saprospiraceae bacterium]
MNNTIKNLEPNILWEQFVNLNAVPRPSKKEERVTAFARRFGESLGLPTIVDEAGNVLIKKKATLGMEDRITVALQGHLDMVHQKNAGTDFDFETAGINMLVEGDWVKAKGTTLGADNGIGVAAIMALLASKDIPHPPLEALFTVDEETGMTGAKALKGGLMKATVMLNLDTEDDTELTIGCAGGVDVTASGTYEEVAVPAGYEGFTLMIKGLTGGHSGMDIHLGRGNANKLMNRLLYGGSKNFGLMASTIHGGSLRNAIPRESLAAVAIPAGKVADFKNFIQENGAVLKAEHQTTDPGLAITLESAGCPAKAFSKAFQKNFLRAVYACPNGIYRMSPDIADLVQTSNNLARVLAENGKYEIQCLTRGSVDSEKADLARAIKSTFMLIGAEVGYGSEYPGWRPNPASGIVKLMSNLYREMFGHEPHVNACHAGLECGIIGTNYPGMEMISFGPNIRGAHSPDEKVQISSVQKFWGFLLETLKRVPAS